ncbi:hypothetical protein [Arthrobacter mobilis]|uniref:Uncharacterized protein n=1 Tax=Arthrobacter mobilis TaxID=2724944 RepID=A0A7X6HH92_9MICC|nr:hypothetical protein [Arthrobacter mobilis]NKX56001.1 hypothetical protein [Arthrobacter mobilis]
MITEILEVHLDRLLGHYSQQLPGLLSAADLLGNGSYNQAEFTDLMSWKDAGSRYDIVHSGTAMILFKDGSLVGVAGLNRQALANRDIAAFTMPIPVALATGML